MLLLAGLEATRGRHLPHLRLPPLRGEYVISNCTSSPFFLIHRAFSVANPIYIFTYFFHFVHFFFFQSKHKEDTFATRPILLDGLELEVYLSLFHVLPCVIMCLVSFAPFLFVCVCIYIYIYIYASPLITCYFLLYFFVLSSSGWARAHLHLSLHNWRGFCYHEHTHGRFLRWGWCGG